MSRRLRIEFEGAIYHVMARGHGRQKIVRDEADRQRLVQGLEHTVIRSGWELLSYVILDNHLHLMFRTPRANLAAGMQAFLSGYAIGFARRHRRPGPLFQSRYRADMIEDETYYWPVSRYIHLNPVRAGLVARPEQWELSSYPGYRYARRRQPWVAYNTLLAAGKSESRADPAVAYIRFVEKGLSDPPESPFRAAFGGWILGSEKFIDQLRRRTAPLASTSPLPEVRQLAALDPKRIFAAVAEFYGLEESALARRHDSHLARPVAAWLCRRHTNLPLRLLAEPLGLSRGDSVPNLVRRLETRLKTSPRLARDLETIMQKVRQATDGPPVPKATPAGKGARSSQGTKRRGS
jgi:REP element-mobilizing transposase RayT